MHGALQRHRLQLITPYLTKLLLQRQVNCLTFHELITVTLKPLTLPAAGHHLLQYKPTSDFHYFVRVTACCLHNFLFKSDTQRILKAATCKPRGGMPLAQFPSQEDSLGLQVL
jgi:hypothetical protein